MKIIVNILFLILGYQSQAQQLISGTYDFQSDANKMYTLYIPSAYEAGTAIDMMVGLHPWNTSRWDAESWCDTLKTFAEMNNVLLVCPDGGADGQVDDAIDTAFTTFLIDEVINDYTINEEQIYAMGFSWGGKTVYTYGLQHAERFAGFMPIGAAVTSDEVSPHVDRGSNEKFYVIHGSNDSPNVRYTPIIHMLDGPHCIESQLLSGVGHTIDFPNRNQILTDAFQSLKSSVCGSTHVDEIDSQADFLQTTVVTPSSKLIISEKYKGKNFFIYDMAGSQVFHGGARQIIAPSRVGSYVLVTKVGSQRFLVR